MMNWTPVQKLSIGAGAALLVLALFGVVALFSVSQLASQRADISDANDAIAKLDQLLLASADAEHAGAEFMMTGAQDADEAFDQARSRVEDAVDLLRQRTEDRPRQRASLDSLGPILGKRFAALSHGILVRKRTGPDAAIAYARADSGRATRGGMLPLVKHMRDEELRTLAEKLRIEELRGKTASTVILAGSIIAFILAALAFTPIKPAVAARLTKRLTTPLELGAIPEFGDSLAESSRQAADRLARLEQLAYVFDKPDSAEVVGEAIITRGLGGLASAVSLVARFDGNAWHVVARRNAKATVGSALPAQIAKIFEDAAKNREPVVMESQSERDKNYPGFPPLGVTQEAAFIAVPCVANGRTSGAFLLAFEGGRVFGDDERAYLATLGRVAGQALVRIG